MLTAAADPIQNLRQPKEIAQRRQLIGYSNNIVHDHPNYPDQAPQSSVNVNFNTHPSETKKIYSNHYQQPYTQNYPTNAPQSQLFNVGYSVSFTNGKPVKPPPKYPRNNNLDDGEIITGTRKYNEQVEVPNVNMSPQEYVHTALISTKKQKISGLKPKPQLIANYQSPKVLLSQANLSPSTQKYYRTLEQLKPQIQNVQELQQKYTWRNLSPGVEIIRSTEVPTGLKYTRVENSVPFEHARALASPEVSNTNKYTRIEAAPFDHGRALGRSQEFDYSNAIDNNSPQQTTLYYNSLRKVQEKAEQQIPVVVNQNVAQLPIDTSLLKEPVAIQVDTRFMDEALRNQGGSYPKYSQSPEQAVQDVNYLQQAYRTIPVEENTQTKPVLVYRQDPQTFQDFQPDQNRFQLKIYGKPQPLSVGFTDGQDEQIKRQPRFLTDLHTNLRPPPMNLSYQRRIRVG